MAWGAVPICCTALCRVLARNGRSMCADECLFLAEKRSYSGHPRKDDFDPNGLQNHSRDLPIAALVTDHAMETWYHFSIA